jgi:hypothetical protein
MAWEELEATVPVFEGSKIINALDRAASVVCHEIITVRWSFSHIFLFIMITTVTSYGYGQISHDKI